MLRASLQRALDSGKRVALALSGGLDSALLLGLLRQMGALPRVRVYIPVTDMPDYCERDAALEVAQQMQAQVTLVHASERDFVAALPVTSVGKIAKNILRERYWQGYSRRIN